MDHLSRLSSYFKEKERKRLDSITKESRDGLPEMTLDEIKLSCLENDGYETPELNDKIYLHFRGFKKIENLDSYTGCKSLWLDSNGFSIIENLDKLTQLRCLYISKNLINCISNLATLQQLTILDLSYNRLYKLSNLSCCPNLQTLNVAHNQLSNKESIGHLMECPNINCLDLTHNRIQENEDIIDLFNLIPSLSSLSINNNEITKLPHFRKKMISKTKKLSYLDRPIEEVERLCADAFLEGGIDLETIVRNNYRQEQIQKRKEEMEQYKIWQQQHRANRLKMNNQSNTNTTDINTISDENVNHGNTTSVLISSSINKNNNNDEYPKLEFTPQQLLERQQLIEEAVAEETLLRNIGYDQVAKQYWLLSNDERNKKNYNLLDQATKNVIDAYNNSSTSESQPNSRVEEIEDKIGEEEVTYASPDAIDTCITTTTTTTSGLIASEMNITVQSILDDDAVVELDDINIYSNESNNPVAEVSNDMNNLSLHVTSDNSLEHNNDTELSRISEQGPSDVVVVESKSSQIIQDSLSLFKLQMSRSKPVSDSTTSTSNANKLNNSSTTVYTKKSYSSTWGDDDDDQNLEAIHNVYTGESVTTPHITYYWTELMDMKLAEYYHTYSHDYTLISQKLQSFVQFQEMTDDEYKAFYHTIISTNTTNNTDTTSLPPNSTTMMRITTESDMEKYAPYLPINHDLAIFLSPTACRMRWYQLNPQQWIDESSTTNITTTTTTENGQQTDNTNTTYNLPVSIISNVPSSSKTFSDFNISTGLQRMHINDEDSESIESKIQSSPRPTYQIFVQPTLKKSKVETDTDIHVSTTSSDIQSTMNTTVTSISNKATKRRAHLDDEEEEEEQEEEEDFPSVTSSLSSTTNVFDTLLHRQRGNRSHITLSSTMKLPTISDHDNEDNSSDSDDDDEDDIENQGLHSEIGTNIVINTSILHQYTTTTNQSNFLSNIVPSNILNIASNQERSERDDDEHSESHSYPMSIPTITSSANTSQYPVVEIYHPPATRLDLLNSLD